MKLSVNMLNFLGYLYEQETMGLFTGHAMCVALAYPFGIRAGLKHEHIVRHRECYRLTDRGAKISILGSIMRRDAKTSGEKEIHRMKAQAMLDDLLTMVKP